MKPDNAKKNVNKPRLSDKVLYLDLSEIDENNATRMLTIAEAQLNRIEENIGHVIWFLVRALLNPESRNPKSRTPIMPDNHTQGQPHYFYVMMTVWYVKRNFPPKYFDRWNRDWDWEAFIAGSKGECPLFDSERLPSENWTFGSSDKDKISLLQWYHYGSILALCKNQALRWKGDEGLKEKVSSLAKAAKISAAAKLSSQPYTADDEIVDRLSFLSDELGLEPRGRSEIGPVTLISMKRVKRRDNARYLNPGLLSSGHKGTTSGPWEVHALCHHSRLTVLSLEEKDLQDWRTKEHTREEIELYKQKIYRFRNAEGTLVSCWERAHARAHEGWLRSEATAVVASTLLIINGKDMKDKLSHTESELEDGSRKEQAPREDASPIETQKAQVLIHDQRSLLLEVKYMESIMKDQLDVLEKFTGEAGRLPPIKWMTFSLPRRYHPDSFFNSIEDTPEKYEAEYLKLVSIPASLRNTITLPQNLPEELPKEPKARFNWYYLSQHLENLCIFDIGTIKSDEKPKGITWEVKQPCKYDRANYKEQRLNPKKRYKVDREKDPRWKLYDSVSKI
jgi:hypothetical protein